jgi:RND family efflux transporter MFP subunit
MYSPPLPIPKEHALHIQSTQTTKNDTMKKYNLTLTLAFAILAASCGKKQEPATTNTENAVIPVQVMSLAQGRAAATFQVSGQFTTDDEVFLSFKTGGIINKTFVKEGDAVREGQLLATLNMTEISAQVAQAEIGFEKANRDYQRVQRLYNDSVATLEQLQNTRSALDLAKQQLKVAEFNKSYSEIRATKSGYVLRKMATEGQLTAPGNPVFQINGARSGNWLLRAAVSDKEWSAIALNDQALIGAGADAAPTYKGVVVHKSEAADAMSGLYTIDIRFSGQKPTALAAGMYGKATIAVTADTGSRKAEGIAIPYDALLDGDGRSGYVFVTNDRKTATKVKVEIAGIEKDSVIISKGLETATLLITMGGAYLNDQSPIAIK